MRSFEDVQALKQSYFNTDTGTAVSNLPPGYVEGFKLTLRPDYKITIGGGITTVGGNLVKTVERDLSGDDWISPKVGADDTGTFFYLYITINGEYRVDRSPPAWSDEYYYYAHPTYGYRVIGKLWLDEDDDVKFVSTEFSDSLGAEITVAPEGYIGEADYYCTGEDDQIIINAAIQYVSTAYLGYGGTVTLLAGSDFNTTVTVSLKSNVALNVSPGAVIKINGDDYAVSAIGSDTSILLNISIVGGGKITRDSSDTSATILVYFYYVNNLKISGTIYNQLNYGAIYLDYCYSFIVSENIIDNDDQTVSNNIVGIKVVRGSGIIKNNTIENIDTSAYFSGITINDSAQTNNDILIDGNIIRNLSCTDSGYFSCGIAVAGDRNLITNNQIYNLTSTDSSYPTGILLSAGDDHGITDNKIRDCEYKGIVIVSGVNRTQVKNNYCYNNGSDTGIANENGDNFSDSGTDTHLSGNSWQQPVSGEPSIGEFHHRYAEIYSQDPGTSDSTVTVSGLPNDVEYIYVRIRMYGNASDQVCNIIDKIDGLYWFSLETAAANVYMERNGILRLDSNHQFTVSPQAAGIQSLGIYLFGYYL